MHCIKCMRSIIQQVMTCCVLCCATRWQTAKGCSCSSFQPDPKLTSRLLDAVKGGCWQAVCREACVGAMQANAPSVEWLGCVIFHS